MKPNLWNLCLEFGVRILGALAAALNYPAQLSEFQLHHCVSVYMSERVNEKHRLLIITIR